MRMIATKMSCYYSLCQCSHCHHDQNLHYVDCNRHDHGLNYSQAIVSCSMRRHPLTSNDFHRCCCQVIETYSLTSSSFGSPTLASRQLRPPPKLTHYPLLFDHTDGLDGHRMNLLDSCHSRITLARTLPFAVDDGGHLDCHCHHMPDDASSAATRMMVPPRYNRRACASISPSSDSYASLCPI